MSFFGSLILFYPSTPPQISVSQLLQLSSDLRQSIGTKLESPCSIEIKYGDRIDVDYECSTQVDWDDSGRIGSHREIEWDKVYGDLTWQDLTKQLNDDEQYVYRGYLSLGSLTKESCAALTRWSNEDPRSGICPDSVSLKLGPVCPSSLSDEELVCTGMVALAFAGNGYFSWGPSWKEYAEQYQKAAPVLAAIRDTKRMFPVPKSESFARIAEHLGDRFLNREYYEPGDWILSIDES